MREILLIVAAVWGSSFVVSVIWFGVDEWKYRRVLDPAERAEGAPASSPSSAHSEASLAEKSDADAPSGYPVLA